MSISNRVRVARVAVVAIPLAAALGIAVPTTSAQAASQVVRLAGTATPATGAFTPSGGDGTLESIPEQEDEEGPEAYDGSITDRSNSGGPGHGASMTSGKKAKSNPTLGSSFEGLNFYQQRYARGGNQFSVEPPDQALCVGNGKVVEAVNDVFNAYDSSGASLLPDNTATNVVGGLPRNVNHAVDLNSLYGYPAAINRATGVRGPNLTDPTCIFDAQTQRYFLVVLTLEVNPTTGAFTLANHLDLAVSKSANPAGQWSVYKIDVTNDGSSNPSPANKCPCLGDYPHIGADANGVYLTTNAYPWNGNGFNGAQIYALSKAQLAAGAATVSMQHIDTFGKVAAPSDAGPTQPGFTVWPAHSPGTSSYESSANGTEYLMSSNAADEATRPVSGTGGPGASSQVVVWSLTNTASLVSATPALQLTSQVLPSNLYAIPPKQTQPGSGSAPTTATPQGHCINNTTTPTIAGIGCWRLLFGAEPPHTEVVSRPDSNDTRMQQVMYANGKLWGALDTALNPDGGAQQAGIAWFIVKPSTATGSLASKMALQDYLGAAGKDLTYPAIGVTPSGRGVMAFTLSGTADFPSAAYAAIDANVGVGDYHVAAAGQATADGFSSYKAQVGGNPPRTRWGDYGAASVDGSSVWIASEYIAHACDYATWGGPFFTGGTGDNLLGTCAGTPGGVGTRAALGNWSTRVSQVTP
jgi:hypothetical protein